jgi:hypothetical protein
MNVTADKSAFAKADKRLQLDGKLAAYVAACGTVGTILASRAEASVITNHTVQPFGINGEVNIDFNGDGQIDYQIDHDRVNLNGNDLDYLQIDKNDVNSAANPLPIDSTATFPLGVGGANDTVEAGYVTTGSTLGLYPSALTYGTPIGPSSAFDFQETDNFNSLNTYMRTNRLIDEDAGQIDTDAGNPVQPIPGTPNFLGLGGEVRYLGVEMGLNNGFFSGGPVNYGWIGIQITNDADATGNVVGWGYQTIPGRPIGAGVPEPSSIVLGAIGGVALTCGIIVRKLFAKAKG